MCVVEEEPPLWQDVPKVVNALAGDVIRVAIGVHRDLGSGLLEKPYQLVLAKRLSDAGHQVLVEHALPMTIDDQHFEKAYVADIVVDDVLLLEIKSVKEVSFAMIKQTKTYLRLGGYPLGLILNFQAHLLYQGVTRVVP